MRRNIGLFHRILVRRRHIDSILLIIATTFILFPYNIDVFLFSFFFGVGLYLIVFRPRRVTPIDSAYAIATVILAAGSIAINFTNGSLAVDWRWASYPTYYLTTLPVAVGVCLVRDPLRQMVIGARLSVAMVAVWAVAALLLGHDRYGFGSNAANAAFAITFIAVITRLEINLPSRFFPNQLAWFYLALLPVLATGTRAVLPVFLTAVLIDLIGLAKRQIDNYPQNLQVRRKTLAALVAIVVLAGILLAPTIEHRVDATISEIEHISTDSGSLNGGMAIRLAQWRSASQVISENPWFGIGGVATKEAILEKNPPSFRKELSKHHFAHNAILDEWMQRGILGVLLICGFLAFCFSLIYRHGTKSMRISVILLTVLTFSFGMLHYLLLVDRHVALYALYFLFLTTANHQRINPSSRISLPSIVT